MEGRYKPSFDDQFSRQIVQEMKELPLYTYEDSFDNVGNYPYRMISQPDDGAYISQIFTNTIARASGYWLDHQLRVKYTNDNLSELEPDPEEDYADTCCDKKERKTIVLITLGILFVAVAGGALMVYISLLSPFTDNNEAKKCEQFPPMFGNKCEFRCHCSNSSEVCDKNFGICQSGCIDGWQGNNCQIITSVFDKSAIFADLPSTHLVQCTINKLWYNWSSVYLTVYNTTETNILINVSQGGEISASDERLNATLSRATGTEADNVTFKFLFGEDDCDLAGMYRCQFDMLGNFNTSYANLSISVQGKSSNLQISTKNVYFKGSTDSINCTLQLADSNADVILTFMDKDNNTLSSTTADEQIVYPEAKCTNLTTFIYNFNATQELNQSRAKCTLRSEANGIVLESNDSVINIVSRSVSVVAVMEPKSLEIVAGKTGELNCFVNVSSYQWTAIHLDFQNESLTRRIVTVNNNTIISYHDQVNASSSIDSEYVNVTFIFNPLTSTDGCSLSGSYTCLIDLVDIYIATESNNTAVIFTALPSDVEMYLNPLYVYGNEDTVNCSANFAIRPTSELLLEVCLNTSNFIAIENYTTTKQLLQQRQLKDGNCTQGMYLTNSIVFNHDMNVSVRCKATDSYLNTTIVTDCIKPNISTVSVVAVMEPKSLEIVAGKTGELTCFVNMSSYQWTAIHLDFQNESLTRRIVTVNNNTIISYHDQVNASSSIDSAYVNVTFILNPLTSTDGCSLSGSYTCLIDLVDKYIATESDSSAVIFTVLPSDVEMYLNPSYVYGNEDTVNCSANFAIRPTSELLLEVCLNTSNFIAIENYTTKQLLQQRQLEDGNCTQGMYLTNSIVFNHDMNVSVRCKATDSYLNTTIVTDCIKPNISTVSVVAVMEPKSLEIVAGKTGELTCFVNMSSYQWTAIHLDFQNESLTRRIVTVNNNTIISYHDQVNASSSIDSAYVNVTFILNPLTSTDGCSLSGSYTCLIDLVDKYIATESDSSAVIFTVLPSDVEMYLNPSYVYGNEDTVNCSANFAIRPTSELLLEVCLNTSNFIAIENYTTTKQLLQQRQLEDGNCTQGMYLTNSIVFNHDMNVSVRCKATDSYLNTTIVTDCIKPNISTVSVVAVMEPKSLEIVAGKTGELTCFVNMSSYQWTAIHLDFQNESLTRRIVTVNNNTIISYHDQVNASSSIDSAYVNVTFILNPLTSTDGCSLSGSYTCLIDLVDKYIATESNSSAVIFTVLPSDVEMYLNPSYVYGNEDTVNCSANFAIRPTSELLLEVCLNTSNFIAIENYTTTKQLLQQRQLEDGNCTQGMYLTNSIVFNHDMNVSVRCKATDSYLNTTIVTDCIKPNISTVSVVAVMEPKSLEIVAGKTGELTCFVNMSSYQWTAIHLDFQNESLTRRIVTVNNNTIISYHDQVNASSSIDSAYVNVTFTLNPLTSTDGCSLSGSYTCLIDLVDKYIATESNSSAVIFTALPSDVEMYLNPSYVYGNEDTVNCSANFAIRPTSELLLEVCLNTSNFIAIENYTTTKQLLQQRQLEDGNCTQGMYLTNSIVFNHDMNVSVRCKATDSYLNTTIVTDCIKPNISTVSVVAVMEPKSLEIVTEKTGELTCFVNVSSYQWTAIHLDFQNESLTRRIVTVNNNTIISDDDQVNASSSIDSAYVNVTFILNPLTSADGCSLSGSYTCLIDLVDKHIATESDSSAVTFTVVLKA
ncbi:uncharacterized protein LOC125657864 isoform X2 [Ostrea edulis]|uniref:uncharacterized protein LOC125657864 isoform X2 n=1 Tax=Ostrea edulis TaxID=37623 RepID=UPI0024AEEFAD|nr:uncharacterized protein LOC125657864 isoform X2 [Ostrea edulis]